MSIYSIYIFLYGYCEVRRGWGIVGVTRRTICSSTRSTTVPCIADRTCTYRRKIDRCSDITYSSREWRSLDTSDCTTTYSKNWGRSRIRTTSRTTCSSISSITRPCPWSRSRYSSRGAYTTEIRHRSRWKSLTTRWSTYSWDRSRCYWHFSIAGDITLSWLSILSSIITWLMCISLPIKLYILRAITTPCDDIWLTFDMPCIICCSFCIIHIPVYYILSIYISSYHICGSYWWTIRDKDWILRLHHDKFTGIRWDIPEDSLIKLTSSLEVSQSTKSCFHTLRIEHERIRIRDLILKSMISTISQIEWLESLSTWEICCSCRQDPRC